MRIHSVIGSADNADVLSGTPLDQLESGGQLDVVAVATGADTKITITGPDNEPIVTSGFVAMVGAGVAPDITRDAVYSLPVRTGGHYTVLIDITAASTWQVLAIYRKRGVDF